MQHKPNPSLLSATFLVVSAAVSIAILGARNIYDDEISSLAIITGSARSIVHFTATMDIHPPGMYLLAHLACNILPSFRWMNLFPCLFVYCGLATFLLQVTPLFARTRSQVCLLLLATLHPQLLLWSTTFRWYSWWTGLALVSLTVALQPRNPEPKLGIARSFILGLLLACLFYLNYITLLFALALAVAMLLRFHNLGWRQLRPGLVTLGVFFLLIAPQIYTLITVHLYGAPEQASGLATSFLRLLLSVSASEAYLPWHPLAIVATLLFAAVSVAGLAAILRLYRSRISKAAILDPPLASIVVFALCFFGLVVITGLGGKPRSGLLLIPVLAPIAALIAGTLRPRIQYGVLTFLVLWSAVGVAHILGRTGLAKASMNDRPEQVVAFIQRTSGSGCSIVVTYDTELAFSLSQARLPNLQIVSPFSAPTLGASLQLPGDDCKDTRLYAVRSYVGGDAAWASTLNDELQSAIQFIAGQPNTDSFSFDPEASRKRALSRIPRLGSDLASAANLPDYRYVVTSGLTDRANLDAMRKRMPDFDSGLDSSSDPAPLKP
jgi:hypothetical protein